LVRFFQAKNEQETYCAADGGCWLSLRRRRRACVGLGGGGFIYINSKALTRFYCLDGLSIPDNSSHVIFLLLFIA
jgi:hypothetical protein